MYRQKMAKYIIILLIIIMATVSTNVYAIEYNSTDNVCKFKETIFNTKIKYNNIIIKKEEISTISILNTSVKVTTTSEETPKEVIEEPVSMIDNDIYYTKADNYLTYSKGVVYYNNHKETYYAEEVLPGKGLNIPGRHVAYDGTIRDEDSYIVVASDLSFMPRGTIVETSLGLGKVYDTGCAYGTIDIYVNASKFKSTTNTNII